MFNFFLTFVQFNDAIHSTTLGLSRGHLFSFKAHTPSSLLLRMGLRLLSWHCLSCPPSLLFPPCTPCSGWFQGTEQATMVGSGEAWGASVPQDSPVLGVPVPGGAFSPQFSHVPAMLQSSTPVKPPRVLRPCHAEQPYCSHASHTTLMLF